jgi:AcrR family transcriptional regulator
MTSESTSESTAPTRLSRSTELLWEAREQPLRGPKPSLTLAQIVDTAIRVADTDGIDALSMRRIARELDVGTMSLYRYIPGKAELLDLMLDRVSEPSDVLKNAGAQSWRETLELSAHDGRQLYLRHPWLLQVNWARPVFGPSTLASVEFVIAGIADLSVTDQQRIMVLMMVDAYVTGSVRHQIMYANAEEETGISDEEFWSTQYPVLERAMATGDYPAMAGLAEDSFEAGWDETFEFGLRCLLDGLERAVEVRHSA